MGAILTGVAVTSGPWLLTVMVLVLMRMSTLGSGVTGVGDAESIITVIYAAVIVLGAPVDIVFSRFSADRVYERRQDQIAAPLRRVLAVCVLVFPLVGVVAMMVLGPPLVLAIPGVILATIVGAQWLLLSAAGGLSSPGIILKAFAIGAPASVLCAFILSRATPLGAAGYLYGFAGGQLVTLAGLLVGTFRALPREEDESARVAPAFRDYWLLAAAAMALHGGIWIDKLVVYLMAGGAAASVYAASAAVAWLSVVPACAYLFVIVETVFERRFRAFYSALHEGASLAELEQLARALRAQVGHALSGTAAIQAGVTLVCLLAAPAVSAKLGLGVGAHGSALTWLLLGAAAQVMALSTTLLLHYFDFRREALIAALVQLTGNGLVTWWVGAPSPILGVGYLVACAITCAVAIVMLQRRMGRLLERTFQGQPAMDA